MPTCTIDGIEREYTVQGSGPTVVFVPTPGFGGWQWSWQFPAVAGPYQALTYQQRETAAIQAAIDSVGQLVEDLEAILATAGVDRAHLVGAGLAGMVALEYTHRYDRARSLSLLATTPGGAEARRPHGPGAVLGASPDDTDALRETTAAGLADDFVANHPEIIDRIVGWRAAEDGGRESWDRIDRAYMAYDRDWPLYTCSLPALILHGTDDTVVPPVNGDCLGEDLPNGTYHPITGAGHLFTIERSREVNDRLIGFLERHADRNSS